MRRLILAFSCIPVLAFAQTPGPQPAPAASAIAPFETILIPRGFVPLIMQAILHPHSVDVGDILTLVQQLDACVADNPVNGAVHRDGPDQCSVVTQALEAQAQKPADAKKGATSPKPH
jgi:hypothetical protein